MKKPLFTKRETGLTQYIDYENLVVVGDVY